MSGCPVQGLSCFSRQPASPQGEAQIKQGLIVRRLEPQRSPKVGFGLPQPTLPAEECAAQGQQLGGTRR
jgi:hypothetical protein